MLKEFKGKGIDSFIDNDIERTKSIGPELIEAIRGSKIAIVLLSRNYASSSWCLNELMEIMNCREDLGQIVMTIFYDVDPTDVKKQTGDFGKAFKKTCKGAMIEKIATDVSNVLNNATPSRDFDAFIGMGVHIANLGLLLRLDLDEVRMVGIWGPSGIGKTSIARSMFNQISSSFQLSTIMVNIKGCYPNPCLDEYRAQLQLQNQMLSQIINQKDIKISHLGVAQERLKDKKVFLVLDDVDRLGQLVALANIEWFGRGSRIIIITEDLRVLNAYGINHIYKVDFPSIDEAIEIFCMYAFGQKQPYHGFALRGMSKYEWKITLPRLKTCLDGEIESILKFGYDVLCDEDKELFLYIACFFNSGPIYKLEELLKNYLDVGKGLRILAEKSLIHTLVGAGFVKMHDLLVQFGKEISRKQFNHGFGKCQILVDARDICEVLSDDTTDGRRIIGINLDLSQIEENFNISEKAVKKLSNLRFLNIYSSDLPHPDRLHTMQGLNCQYFRKLISLRWMHFQKTSLPSTFNSEFLVELTMHDSKLQKLWEGTKPLRNIKWMVLSNSKNLKELPDLSTATNLETLILENCSSLMELPSSIGKLSNLDYLCLGGCSSLLELPSFTKNVTGLVDLDLRGCSSLVEIPSSIGHAINLRILDLSKCSSLVGLPSFVGNAINLRNVYLKGCSNLVELPSSIVDLINLEKLDLSGCSSLVELPCIRNAVNLQMLDLSDCSSLVKLPSFVGNATKLEKLNLTNCSNLLELPSIDNATNLQELLLENCSRLMKLPSTLRNAINLQLINLKNCSNVVKIPAIENVTNLNLLDLSGCSSLVEIPPSIGTVTSLHKLYLNRCSSLVELPSSIGNITSLQELNLQDCSNLLALPFSIGNLHKLQELHLSFFFFVKQLHLSRCSKLEVLPININLESLKVLDLIFCTRLKIFPEISTNIVYLNLVGTTIEEVPLSIRSWPRLDIFCMSYFENLNEFPHALDIITCLHLSGDIQEVATWVKGISRLDQILLYGCKRLVSLPQLPDILSDLDTENCASLEKLDCSFHNSEIRLNFANCFKLNKEARDLIIQTSTSKYAILPGREVSSSFTYRAAGDSVTVKLNEGPLPTSLRFKVCVLIIYKGDEKAGDTNTKHGEFFIFYLQNGNIGYKYLDPLVTGHQYIFEVEAEVTSSEFDFYFAIGREEWKIVECGVCELCESLHVDGGCEVDREACGARKITGSLLFELVA
ncbi:predicted protein [Arabidopsis lyrata subsp. lyrata]|uniref:ADP-ribosyl cyclase/cyclic ADP-ribose hydrolase n=1 Tax=Arabidopsis lyrata subsp. lyrata TaxID=81972 RepID=D7MI74_ARALL|nr:predicted protein [Arabidopsis lyrata subsp. lyrata]